MKFEKLNEKVFDGDTQKAYMTDMFFSVRNLTVKFNLKDLTDYSELENNIYPNELSNVQAHLGFEVINFDGYKIFQGRKNGLRLYFLIKDDRPNETFLFSCGEFQAGRFQIFLEACLMD